MDFQQREYESEQSFINKDVASGIFIRGFIKDYYHKKRKWPPLRSCPPQIEELHKMNIYPGIEYEFNYSLWNEIIFDKLFDYDYSPDTTELLKYSAPDLDQ